MHAEEDSAGFWPGYVAAVASLVQALLLLSAVLAMAVFQLGLLIGQQMDAKAALAMTIEKLSDTAADQAARQKDDAEAPLNVTFSDAVWQLSEGEAAQVTNELQQLQQRQAVTRWRVWLPTQTDDPRKRRFGFLRVMALRNVLIKSGIAPDKIDVQLLQVAEAEGVDRRSADAQTVYISPQIAPTKGRP
jgi:hypothetical protein